jgi:hypothetical protein
MYTPLNARELAVDNPIELSTRRVESLSDEFFFKD